MAAALPTIVAIVSADPSSAESAVPTLEAPETPRTAKRRTWPLGVVAWLVLGAAAAAGVWVAIQTRQRVQEVEQELVRRQSAAQEQVAEARMLARQAREAALEAAAKVALLEARVAEVAVQRSQIEELMQSMSRSRDENVLLDIDAALRVAQRQSLITGSAEPLVAALVQADERLARYDQPRLEGVRRAVARDLDRIKSVGVTDIAALTVKLDEATRLVDESALLAAAAPQRGTAAPRAASAPEKASTAPAPTWRQAWDAFGRNLWAEVRSLVRVTQVEHPEAALLAPDQGFFLRENLKLRLLNARLALLSRQFDLARGDVLAAQRLLERYFDRSSRQVVLLDELLRQVATQARHVNLPRPDETLAALAVAAAAR